MRPTLLHPLGERRHSRRQRRARGAKLATFAATETQAVEPTLERVGPLLADPAVKRAREAGGPIDRACYSCQCGYVFEAAVSTTVSCPHCGAGQAW
jgi:hypothetical protein